LEAKERISKWHTEQKREPVEAKDNLVAVEGTKIPEAAQKVDPAMAEAVAEVGAPVGEAELYIVVAERRLEVS